MTQREYHIYMSKLPNIDPAEREYHIKKAEAAK